MDIREEIKVHDEAVRRDDLRCGVVICGRCHGSPGEFRLHERRRRTFWVVVARLVEKMLTFLLRWKCPLCGGTFTEYPAFALRHKRYVSQEVFGRSGRYVQEDARTYEDAVQDRNMPVFHEGDFGKEGCRCLSAVTVWRWVGFTSGLKETFRKVLRMIRGKCSRCDLSRRVYPVPAWKYRSEVRRKVLEQCKRLFDAEAIYRRLFGVSNFPHFGIAGSSE